MITIEMIRERIASLEAERDDTLGKLNAIGGAIQDCQMWLNGLLVEEAETKAAPVPAPAAE